MSSSEGEFESEHAVKDSEEKQEEEEEGIKEETEGSSDEGEEEQRASRWGNRFAKKEKTEPGAATRMNPTISASDPDEVVVGLV